MLSQPVDSHFGRHVRLTSILYSELKEAIPAAMNGLDGIKARVPFRSFV